jgi:hypothetical protein
MRQLDKRLVGHCGELQQPGDGHSMKSLWRAAIVSKARLSPERFEKLVISPLDEWNIPECGPSIRTELIQGLGIAWGASLASSRHHHLFAETPSPKEGVAG